MAFVGNLAAAKPEVLDNVDMDETVREYADLIGVTQKLIVAQQKRDAIRKERIAGGADAAGGADKHGGGSGGEDFELRRMLEAGRARCRR